MKHKIAYALTIMLVATFLIATAKADWGVSDDVDVSDAWDVDGYPTPTIVPATPTPNSGAGGGGGGTGETVYTINIKVTKGGETLQNVVVELTSTNLDEYQNTNAHGIAIFDNIKAGTYQVYVFSDNLLTKQLFNGTIVVTHSQTFTIDLDAQTVTPDNTPTPTPFIQIEASFPFYVFLIVIGAGVCILLLAFMRKKK